MRGNESRIAVVVGTVTDDPRLATNKGANSRSSRFAPCASRRARAPRITKAGGECITLDQLALRAPTGSNTVLLRGPKKVREVYRHFGHRSTVTSVNTHCNVKPYVRGHGKARTRENARGRRRSRGFKV